ncbi:hypothetical protein NA57DRAFT_57307 [Rhizodiscina lignyota]|uniref:Uncharacterized protein n=1 Tax=Rhizodiscina lignyota TaxID=1504668 RepID=A0A9P4M4W1_9PEZI|nr:hypothetical protein NA57DRAFT_57307 [Rhizodiscina lignyota]
MPTTNNNNTKARARAHPSLAQLRMSNRNFNSRYSTPHLFAKSAAMAPITRSAKAKLDKDKVAPKERASYNIPAMWDKILDIEDSDLSDTMDSDIEEDGTVEQIDGANPDRQGKDKKRGHSQLEEQEVEEVEDPSKRQRVGQTSGLPTPPKTSDDILRELDEDDEDDKDDDESDDSDSDDGTPYRESSKSKSTKHPGKCAPTSPVTWTGEVELKGLLHAKKLDDKSRLRAIQNLKKKPGYKTASVEEQQAMRQDVERKDMEKRIKIGRHASVPGYVAYCTKVANKQISKDVAPTSSRTSASSQLPLPEPGVMYRSATGLGTLRLPKHLQDDQSLLVDDYLQNSERARLMQANLEKKRRPRPPKVKGTSGFLGQLAPGEVDNDDQMGYC